MKVNGKVIRPCIQVKCRRLTVQQGGYYCPTLNIYHPECVWNMVERYACMVAHGLITINDVPRQLREGVKREIPNSKQDYLGEKDISLP